MFKNQRKDLTCQVEILRIHILKDLNQTSKHENTLMADQKLGNISEHKNLELETIHNETLRKKY